MARRMPTLTVEEVKRSPERVTLKTLSRLTGLAATTVSRALGDAPDIGKDTKEMVQRTAREVGYRPNRAGVRLRTGRTNVISLILPSENSVMDHTAQLITSMSGVFRDTQFHMNITPYFADQDPMEPVRYVVETQSADVIVLTQIAQDDPRVRFLLDENFPFVTLGRSKWAHQHSHFDFDNVCFGRLGAETLMGDGWQNIALLSPSPEYAYTHHIIAGATEALTPVGKSITVIPNVVNTDPLDVVEQRVGEFLQANPHIDGVICSSSSSCIATVCAIEALGRQVGVDCGVFSREALPILKKIRPTIRTSTEGVLEAGTFIAEAAMQLIQNPDQPPRQLVEQNMQVS